jgi:hypothetical protein
MDKKEIQHKRKVSKAEIEQALLANFISMQKVLTNLSVKFEDLSGKMERLLELFEISAKSFSEKYAEGYSERSSLETGDTEFLKKLDSLLDQNKTIAKGIMLMEDRIRNRSNPQFSQQSQQQNIEQSIDPFRQRNPLPRY